MKLDSWEQALTNAMGDRADVVPADWITVNDWGAKARRSPATASRDIRLLFSIGQAEKKMFRVERNGVVRPVPHYRLKKK